MNCNIREYIENAKVSEVSEGSRVLRGIYVGVVENGGGGGRSQPNEDKVVLNK